MIILENEKETSKYFYYNPCRKCGDTRRYKSTKGCPNCIYIWSTNNRDKRTAAGRRFAKNHPDVRRANNKLNKKRIKSKIPKWVDKEEKAKIEKFYNLARYFTYILGEEFHVDHIIPLQGKLINGLHVSNNLQILPAKENLIKNNKFMEI